MRIQIVGDTSGNTDEGMKKVSARLTEHLKQYDDCDVSLISMKDLFKKQMIRKGEVIVHFMGGPTWRTLVAGIVFKFIINRKSRIVISFIHPKWNKITHSLFKILKPAAAVVQTEKWKNTATNVAKIVSNIPLGGVDLDKFCLSSPSEKISLKKELGLPLNKIVVLHVGHLNRGRNLTVLNGLRDCDDIFPLVIGSSTVIPDEGLMESLENSNVKIICRYLPDVERYFKAADCYLFPTLNPDFAIQLPLSVLESLSCGTPVLATKYEALPFFLDQTPGLLNYIDSFSSIDMKIRDIIEEKEKLGRKMAFDMDRFQWKSISKEVYELYLSILNNA